MQNILYTRVSTNSQGNESLEIQNQICLNFLNSKGLTLHGSYQEIGSAYNGNQNCLNNIINNYKNINLYVLNISRFSRNIINGLDLIQRANKNNINIIFIEEELNTANKNSIHQIRVKLSEAQMESETISNRISNLNNILLGKGWKFGAAEFGKRATNVGGVRTFLYNNEEKKIIDFIIEAREGISALKLNNKLKKIDRNFAPINFYDSDGITKISYFDKSKTLSFPEIADLLNDYNIKKRGKEWTASMVSSIYNKSVQLNNIGSLSI